MTIQLGGSGTLLAIIEFQSMIHLIPGRNYIFSGLNDKFPGIK
jgi:hypothetical protein